MPTADDPSRAKTTQAHEISIDKAESTHNSQRISGEELATLQRLKGIEALNRAKELGWLHGKMPTYLAALCTDIRPFHKYVTSHRFTNAKSSFLAAGITEKGYWEWRRNIFPALHTIWLLGAARQGKVADIINDDTFGSPEETQRALSLTNPRNIQAWDLDIEGDIGRWYVKHFVKDAEANREREIPSTPPTKSTIASQALESVEAENKYDPPKQPAITQSNPPRSGTTATPQAPKRRKGNFGPITMADLEKTGMTPNDLIKDWKLNPRGNHATDDQSLKQDLSNKAWTAIKNNEKVNGTFQPPARISASREGRWHRYAVIEKGRGAKGHKYGLIKDDDQED